MVLWPGLGRREGSLRNKRQPAQALTALRVPICLPRRALAFFLFSGELPICQLCDLLACFWIRADGVRISHYYAKMPVTYFACNSRQNFHAYFTIVCLRHGNCWNSFRAACSPIARLPRVWLPWVTQLFLRIAWQRSSTGHYQRRVDCGHNQQHHGTNNRNLQRLSRPTWWSTRRSK